MSKAVLLIMDQDAALDFETTGEAIAYAEAYSKSHEQFDVYTLFKSGTMGSIQWTLSADTATNLRENAKAKAAPRTQRHWTETELTTLKDAHSRGMAFADIAEALGRTYKSVYSRLWKMGVL